MDLFTLGSSAKRPDSERLLYQSSCQVLRPPTAPLTPNAPPGAVRQFADPWFMASDDGLPPPPSQPPTLNLFEALGAAVDDEEDDAPAVPPARGDEYWSTDTRLNHIVDYLQKRSAPLAEDQPPPPISFAADWPPDPTEDDESFTPFANTKRSPQSDRSRTTAPRGGAKTPTPAAGGGGGGGSSSRNRGSASQSSRAPVKGWWKTEICKFWKESGGCRNDKNCRWAHGDHELRSPTPEPGESAATVQPWVLVADYAANLQRLWELLKIKNQSMKQVEENSLIAGPPLVLDEQYWKEVGEILAPPPKPLCTCCGSTSPAPDSTACASCLSIAMEKIHSMSLVPQSSSSSPSHNDRKKLVHWGLSLATLLKNIDELTWFEKGAEIYLSRDFNNEISDWTRHKRSIARAVLIMRCYIDSLANNRRTRLLTTELLPSLSLVDWCVVSGQPVLFVSLIANGFPVQLSSTVEDLMVQQFRKN